MAVIRGRLADVYTADRLAAMYLDRYSRVPYVCDFARQIDEAIRTYFCGYGFAVVTGVLPVVEGIMRKIATSQSRNVGHGTRKLNQELQDIVDRELSSPHCYGERLVMLEAFRDFVKDRLLQNTDDYVGLNEFNRHGILHGLFENFGQDINFFRLITLLDLLCFSIGLIHGGVSMSAPALTSESQKLAAVYATLHSFHLRLEPRP